MPALSERLTYKRAHLLVRRAKGRATDHTCVGCSGHARFWAYQHNDPAVMRDAFGRPYSANPDCYAPMCQRCHRQYDIDTDTRVREAAQAVGQQRGRGNAERLKTDPEYAERMRGVNQVAVKKVQNQRRKCAECDMVSTPFGIGSHQRKGHQGYIDLGELT